jgi:hypothetical protein
MITFSVKPARRKKPAVLVSVPNKLRQRADKPDKEHVKESS